MPRVGVSFEEVAETCARLEGAGEKVTVRRVQSELGGRSSATVLAHCQRWLAERRNRTIAANTASEFSATFRTALLAEFDRQASAARADSEQRLAETVQLYEGAAQSLTASEQQVDALTAMLERERTEAAEQAGGLQQEVAALRAQLQEVEQQRAAAHEELARARGEATELRSQLLQAKTEAAATLERLRLMEQQAARSSEEAQVARKNAEENQGRAIATETTLTAVQQRAREIDGDKEQFQQRLAETLKLLEQEHHAATERGDQREAAEKRATAAEATLVALQQRLAEYKDSEAERKAELAALRDELRREIERRAAFEQKCSQLEASKKAVNPAGKGA